MTTALEKLRELNTDGRFDAQIEAMERDAPACSALLDREDAAHAEVSAAHTLVCDDLAAGEIYEVARRAAEVVRQQIECRRNGDAFIRHIGPDGYRQPLTIDAQDMRGHAGVLFAAKPSDVHELGTVVEGTRYELGDIIASRPLDWGTGQVDGKSYPCDWRGRHCGVAGGAPARSYIAVARPPFLVLIGLCGSCESEVEFSRAGQQRNENGGLP